MTEDAKIVILVFQMLGLLGDAGEAFEAEMNPKQMGIHPKNRNGKKMQHASMHKKGMKFYTVGFRLQLCGSDKAIAFENNPTTNDCEQHTINLTSSSNYFASYARGAIRAGSVGCSHLNQWLAAVQDGAQTDYETLCEHGKTNICTRHVVEGNDELERAVFKGLKWLLIKWQIAVEYPELPQLIQRALNVEHHVGEGYCCICY